MPIRPLNIARRVAAVLALWSIAAVSPANDVIEVVTPSVCCAKPLQITSVHGSVSVMFQGEGVDLGMAQGPDVGAHKTLLRVQAPNPDATRQVKIGVQVGVGMMKGSSGSIRLAVNGTTQSWKLKGPWNAKVYKFVTVRLPKGQDQVLLMVDLEAVRSGGSAAQLVLDSLDVVTGKLVDAKGGHK